MHLLRSVLLAAACLIFSALAAPVPTAAVFSTRDIETATLLRRALTPLQVHQHSAATLARQAQKKERVKVPSSKADRKAKWVAAKGHPGVQNKPKTRLTQAEKTQVTTHLRTEGQNLRNTRNLPHRKDTFTVGGRTTTGKQARTAAMNSYLTSNTPVRVSPKNIVPKTFHNYPFRNSHPNTALRGQRPVNNPTGAVLTEFPVTKRPGGWIGKGNIGTARVLTSKDNNNRHTFHGVIGHDPSQSSNPNTKNLHYSATHTPHRNVDHSSFVGDAHPSILSR